MALAAFLVNVPDCSVGGLLAQKSREGNFPLGLVEHFIATIFYDILSHW